MIAKWQIGFQKSGLPSISLNVHEFMTTGEKRQMESPDITDDDLFLTLPEVARILKLSHYALYRLLPQGKIPGAVKIGGSWRIRREKFFESLRAKETDGTDER